MTTKDTLTLLREVEAALEDAATRTDQASYNENVAYIGDIAEDLKKSLPAIQELIRRASVGVDEYGMQQKMLSLLRAHEKHNYSVAYMQSELMRIIRPHLAPVASGWMTPAQLKETFRKFVHLPKNMDTIEWTELDQAIMNEIAAQPPQAKGAGDEG